MRQLAWMALFCLVLAGCAAQQQARPTPEQGTPAQPSPLPIESPAASPTIPPAAAPVEIVVFAASSLTQAFHSLANVFQAARPTVKVTFHFAGSPTLRTQLEQGAKADLLATADQRQMDLAAAAGVVEGRGVPFAGNSLVVITPADGTAVRTLADLAKPGVKVVLGQPDVPVGLYARAALKAMETSAGSAAGYYHRVLANVVSQESNVRQVVAKVALGEADAGFVYRTDIAGDLAAKVQGIPLPAQVNPSAMYPIALTRHPANREAAQAFLEFILSADGQAVLASHGFASAHERP